MPEKKQAFLYGVQSLTMEEYREKLRGNTFGRMPKSSLVPVYEVFTVCMGIVSGRKRRRIGGDLHGLQ